MTELSEDQIQNRIVCNRCNEDYTGQMIEIISMSADGNCQMCRAELSGKFCTSVKPVVSFSLDYPPSVNSYWKRNRNGSVRISDKGVKYKQTVKALLHGRTKLTGRLKGSFVVNVPDRRRRDLDNTLKAILDSMQGHVFLDDEQFDEITVKRGAVVKHGRIDVELYEIEDSK